MILAWRVAPPATEAKDLLRPAGYLDSAAVRRGAIFAYDVAAF
ncbi:MAG TPA: hypothetical protein VHC22_04435 [Pirellulales bacterium]|nr:hypothetical protein [Pirellulales bacterium]